MESRKRRFITDDRAIEGLPIRLVIALIIGVVSLGIMLQILGGVGDFSGDTEVDVEFIDDHPIEDDEDDFTVEVIDEEGREVPDATVIATASASVRMDPVDGETNSDGQTDLSFDSEGDLELAPDADIGQIEFEIVPPSDSDWTADEPNNELVVTR